MLTFEEQTRILREVIMGSEPPTDEPAEQEDFRQKCQRDKTAADQAGYTLDIPNE